MKHAIVLLAHKGYDYIDNFLSQFNNDPDFYYFIHLDTKCEWNPNKVQELKDKYNNIKLFTSQINGKYCEFNLIQSELICIREAYKFGCDYYHTMSELDFLICSVTYFKGFFEKNNGKEYLYYRKFEEGTTCSKDIDSVINIHINHIYNGTQWWSLTHKCISLVLEKDIKYNAYYDSIKGYKMAFDEVYFQNIILADLKDEDLNIVSKSLRYVDWVDLEDPEFTHPNMLLYSKKYKYLLGDNLIIRKVDFKNEDSQKYLKYVKKHFIEFNDYIQKKVLICMCVRNRAKIMLPSIKSVLDQTYRNMDVLFIDDDSTDNTLETLINIKRTHYNHENTENLRKQDNLQCNTWYEAIKIIKTQKHDFITARNLMFNNHNIDINKYDYIAIIDSDDLYKQDKIEQQLRYFEEHPELDVVSSKIIFDTNASLTYTQKDLVDTDVKKLLTEDKINMVQICHFPSILIKRSVLDVFTNKVYFYPEFKDGGEDQIFIYTLLSKGKKFGVCSKSVYLYNYCKYSDSISSNAGKHNDKSNYVFKEFFDKSYNDKIEFVNKLFNKYNG